MKWVLIDHAGSVVKKGDEIKDFRDDPWIFIGVSRPPEPGKSGKVNVHMPDNPQGQQEFYDSVFNCRIEGM